MIGPEKDLEVYVSTPAAADNGGASSTTKAIMVFTDVYGFQNRLYAICDKLANDLDVIVIALDCFRGETKDGHLDDVAGWLRRHPYEYGGEERDRPSKVHPVVGDIRRCLDFLSQRYGVSDTDNVGAMGFCWGVWALTKACAAGGLGTLRCAVGFHPSLMIEDAMFGMDQLAIAGEAARRAPLLFCVAGNDLENLKPPGGEVAKMISSSDHHSDGGGLRPRCVEFPNMIHGWVSRGDTNVDAVREDAEKALKMATDFFASWM